jgi:hypothetical protein
MIPVLVSVTASIPAEGIAVMMAGTGILAAIAGAVPTVNPLAGIVNTMLTGKARGAG